MLRKTEFVEDQCGPHLQPVYVRSQAVVSRRISGETLIVPVRGKVGDLASIYSFNETGSLIWQSMESPKSLADLISAVQQEYAVSYEQAERDVKQFLNDTLSVGLVEERQEVSLAAFNSSQREGMQSGSR
ncbi:MAG: PqqD family protein [Candidatus Sulfotelmatobacter sp.]